MRLVPGAREASPPLSNNAERGAELACAGVAGWMAPTPERPEERTGDALLQILRQRGLADTVILGGAARDRLLAVSSRCDVDLQMRIRLTDAERSRIGSIRRLARFRWPWGGLLYSLAMRCAMRGIQARHEPDWAPLLWDGVLENPEGLFPGTASFRGVRVERAKRVLVTAEGEIIPENRVPSFELVALSPEGEVFAYDAQTLEDIEKRRVRIAGCGALSIRTVMRMVSIRRQFAGTSYDEGSWREMEAYVGWLRRGRGAARFHLQSRHARRVILARLGETIQRAGDQWPLAVEDLDRLGLLPLIESACPEAGSLIRYRRALDGGAAVSGDEAAFCEPLLSSFPRQVFPLDAPPRMGARP
ncbi:MAG TPA: hypothetical protein P5567_14225 [Kiritimatiellia bacterium]|nr:hypothetical protein [Kiritimatiellia bacterium]HRZ13599.1 hypothetical protein [Kiritimatiellia bacterium]HSA19305.1 hypothetical protein [Kiritimatiellia bacterium]